MKTLVKKMFKIKPSTLLTSSLLLGSAIGMNAQNMIDDGGNTSGHNENFFQFRTGLTTDYNSSGITLGDRTIGDYSTNLFYRGTTSPSNETGAFNIFMYKWGGTSKTFSINRHGDTEVGQKLTIGGDEIRFDATDGGVDSRLLMQRDYNGERYLLFNAGAWDASEGRHVADFDGGAVISSKVLIDPTHSWYSDPEFATDAALSVDGKIYCEGLKCQLSGDWADYVFKSDYKLKTLDEVESYIDENGHLPGVPSAATIEKEGLEVADMQKIQMEKIEELTLYMIELKKENKLLKAENNQFKEQNERIESLERILLSK